MREVEFERVHGRVDAQLGDLARQHGGGVEMGEGGGRGRVGQIVGRHVHGLHRGDRALVGRGDPLLQRAHVGGQRRLVAHGRRDAAEQGRHLGTRLGEAEDVVDEEQHVLAFLVAEIFRDGEAGQGHARAGARRLVHLAVDQRHLRLQRLLEVDDAGLDHLVIEVIALAGPLADAGEHRNATVRLGDVVDQLHDQHGLADAGTAEQADLAALEVGGQQIDDLDAGDQHLGLGRLVDEVRGRGMDRRGDRDVDRAALVDGLADDVQDPAQRRLADRDRDRGAGVEHVAATGQPVGRVHGHGADRELAQLLRHLQHQPATTHVRGQRVQDRRQRLLVLELHVDHGAQHLGDPSDRHVLVHTGLVHVLAPKHARGRSRGPRHRR